ncbi:MAG: DUF4327 family protein [Cyanobacteria bacterium J06650_10]
MLQTRQRYSIQIIREEVRALVAEGALGKHVQLYSLSRFFDSHAWEDIERLLTLNEYLLRDSVYDLIGQESWMND